MKYYFAYGSNMYIPQFKDRLSFTTSKVGILEDHTLVFNKKSTKYIVAANIEFKPGEVVEGILFTILGGEMEMKKLDAHEPGYYRKEDISILVNGKIVKADTYFALKIVNGLNPKREYLNIILAGARGRLSDKYFKKLEKIQTY